MQTLQFPKGNYYLIICKASEEALRIQESDPVKYENSRIIGTQPNPQDNGQLFMIEKVGKKDDDYEFVNCISALVFDEEGSEIRLKTGKRFSDQLFAIIQAPSQGDKKYYWIKTDNKGTKALHLEEVLRYGQFDPASQSQLFRFQLVNNGTIQNSAIIINNMTGKVLDVPRATRKAGERIIQWEKNKRWNQRWFFQRQGKAILIKSALNGLCLDIAGESRDNGAKVIQWTQTGGTNQQWFPQPCGNNIFKFRSVHESTLFLAIRKQTIDNGGELEVCSQENPTMYWKIEGAKP